MLYHKDTPKKEHQLTETAPRYLVLGLVLSGELQSLDFLSWRVEKYVGQNSYQLIAYSRIWILYYMLYIVYYVMLMFVGGI